MGRIEVVSVETENCSHTQLSPRTSCLSPLACSTKPSRIRKLQRCDRGAGSLCASYGIQRRPIELETTLKPICCCSASSVERLTRCGDGGAWAKSVSIQPRDFPPPSLHRHTPRRSNLLPSLFGSTSTSLELRTAQVALTTHNASDITSAPLLVVTCRVFRFIIGITHASSE